MNKLTYAVAKEYFVYVDPYLYRVKKTNNRFTDKDALIDSKRNRTKLKGIEYPVDKIIWLLKFKSWPEQHIHHIDGNKLNNSLINLTIK